MRLLVIEDDDDIALVIQETLRAEGFDTDRASNGVDGLWLAREGIYGLIVLDILMEGMNGYKVCEQLRSEGIAVPVIMLTAKVGDLDETDGFEAGADDYLRKPFSPSVLVARVRALLRRGRANDGLQLKLTRGGIELDVEAMTCSFKGGGVTLTPRQFQVLEALLRSGDAPISRLDLVRTVWGLEFDGDPNVADVYLGYLRTKLSKETIENVRGVGFRVRA